MDRCPASPFCPYCDDDGEHVATQELLERYFAPYELKWLAATPLQQPAPASWICRRAGIGNSFTFAHFVRKNPDLFERHGGLTPCWEYRLSPRGSATLRAQQEKTK